MASIDEFSDDEQDPFNLATAAYLRGAVEHLRGPTSAAMVDDLIEVLGFYREDTDPQIQGFYLNSVAQLQADIARWDDAFETGLQTDIRLSNAGLYIAAQAAAWTRDLERLETVAELLAECPIPSVALRGYVEAARTALQGDTAAASAMFARLIDDQSRKLYGSYLTQFRATFAMLVGQDDPAAAQAAADAAEWLTRTGSGTLRRLWAEGLPADSREELAG